MNAPDVGSYKELLLFLGTAGVIVLLFSRLKISPVLGFLAAGIGLGPPLQDALQNTHSSSEIL
jgi:monovalent cation:H+ antiporter-2, CPA2 family